MAWFLNDMVFQTTATMEQNGNKWNKMEINGKRWKIYIYSEMGLKWAHRSIHDIMGITSITSTACAMFSEL